ncbi:MAG: hypothetical protein K2J64_00220 [Desulfovibrio sp.]|nr:hypothetical protein [Desulfovibrio sp.]
MNDIDLSDDTLLHRREMAERVASWKPALFGPNQYDDSYSLRNGKDDAVIPCHGSGVDGKGDLASHLAVFILFNPPEAVMADIDEILRLRAEVERLEREADWLAQQFRDCPDEVEPEGEYWDICKMEDCAGVGKEDVAACWRRAARKAVEPPLESPPILHWR